MVLTHLQPEGTKRPAQERAEPESPGREAPLPAGPADDAWDIAESGEGRQILGREKDGAPAVGAPPPLALHPTAADSVAAPITPGAAWAGGAGLQRSGPAWPVQEAGLSRTPSYPSTSPSSTSTSLPPSGSWLAGFKRALHKLKQEVVALNYAVQDPRVGFLPRLLALLTIAYLLSPMDLLPDVIPVIGLVDDLVIVPALLMLAVWLIPDAVMADARERAEREPLRLGNNWGMAAAFFLMWDALLLALLWWGLKRFGSSSLRQWQWWIMGGAALALAAGEAAWSWDRHRQEVQQEAERAAARLARIRARAQRAAYCAAAATRVWPEPPLQPTVRWPADAPTPAAAAGRGGKAIDPELRTALLADEWEP